MLGQAPAPQVLGGIGLLAEVLGDPSMATTDGWGNPLWYASDGTSHRLLSHGKDGAPDEPIDDEAAAKAGDGYEVDILLADGSFLR